MPKPFDRCVAHIKSKNDYNPTKYNPYAICSNSTGWKRKKGGGWKHESKKSEKECYDKFVEGDNFLKIFLKNT